MFIFMKIFLGKEKGKILGKQIQIIQMLFVYGYYIEFFLGDGDLNELLIFYKFINFS